MRTTIWRPGDPGGAARAIPILVSAPPLLVASPRRRASVMGGRTESTGACRYTAAIWMVIAVAGCREEPSELQAAPAEDSPEVRQAPGEPPPPAAPSPSPEPAQIAEPSRA